jgi:hypothetical protein
MVHPTFSSHTVKLYHVEESTCTLMVSDPVQDGTSSMLSFDQFVDTLPPSSSPDDTSLGQPLSDLDPICPTLSLAIGLPVCNTIFFSDDVKDRVDFEKELYTAGNAAALLDMQHK